MDRTLGIEMKLSKSIAEKLVCLVVFFNGFSCGKGGRKVVFILHKIIYDENDILLCTSNEIRKTMSYGYEIFCYQIV